jgi:hypothetical protein
MSTTYLNTKSRGLTKTVAEFSKQDGQSKQFRSIYQGKVLEHRKEGIDVFKSQDQEMTETTNTSYPQWKRK